MAQTIPYKTYLNEEEMPRTWYNLKAVMKAKHAPFLNPKTLQPCTREELCKVFCEECVDQELNDRDERIEIPAGIAEFYRMFRPSPLVRAYFLERMLDTPAEIYYKFEGNNTSGSHKLNSAAAQAYYAKRQGLVSITTETGAGQWGTALAMAAAFYGLKLDVFMVKVSYEQKPYRREVMRTYGANVVASPSVTTAAGRKILEKVRSAARSRRQWKKRSLPIAADTFWGACSITSCFISPSSGWRRKPRSTATALRRISSSAAWAGAPTSAG